MIHEKRFPLVDGREMTITVALKEKKWYSMVEPIGGYGIENDLITDRIKETYAEAYEALKPDILK